MVILRPLRINTLFGVKFKGCVCGRVGTCPMFRYCCAHCMSGYALVHLQFSPWCKYLPVNLPSDSTKTGGHVDKPWCLCISGQQHGILFNWGRGYSLAHCRPPTDRPSSWKQGRVTRNKVFIPSGLIATHCCDKVHSNNVTELKTIQHMLS